MRKFNQIVSVQNIQELFSDEILKIVGNTKVEAEFITSMNNVADKCLTWVGLPLMRERNNDVSDIEATIIISDNEIEGVIHNSNQCIIYAKKSKRLFVKIIQEFFEASSFSGIHPSVVIDPEAKIADSVSIGPNSIIGKAEIGENTVIEGNVFIYDNVIIGNNVIIQGGAVIGSKGMSLARNDNNKLEGFPNLGYVVLKDDVEIGSNCVIDQSILEKTIIGKGTKVNSLTFIGNSVQIGTDNYISVQVNINGSVKIGNNNFIGSGSTIRNKKTIGNNNTIGAGAVVVKDFTDNLTLTGNPAIINVKSKGVKL